MRESRSRLGITLPARPPNTASTLPIQLTLYGSITLGSNAYTNREHCESVEKAVPYSSNDMQAEDQSRLDYTAYGLFLEHMHMKADT